MSETDALSRLRAAIMRLRHGLFHAGVKRDEVRLDCFMGEKFEFALLGAMRHVAMYATEGRGARCAKLYDCSLHLDRGLAPSVAYLNFRGVPVRRVRLDGPPSLDNVPLRDSAELTGLQACMLQHLETRGAVTTEAPWLRVAQRPEMRWAEAPTGGDEEAVSIQTITSDDPGLEGFIELTRRDDGRHTIRLTHMGRYALEQHRAAGHA